MSFDSRDKSKFDGRIGLLKIFAGIINPSETSEIDITLNVHGTIVSGKMIGMKRYYDEIGKVFIDAIIDTSPENTSPIEVTSPENTSPIEVTSPENTSPIEVTSPENTSPAKEIFKMLFSEIESLSQKELEGGEFEFNHIFMRNVKIYNGGQIIPITGTTYWVGKIQSVDGFLLGMMHPES